jgi:HEAT repeat protein
VIAGWSADEPGARELLASDDGGVRASALAALVRMDAASLSDLAGGIADASPLVRCRALRALPARWIEARDVVDLRAVLGDPDPVVIEVACFVAGECLPPQEGTVERLCSIATGHDDVLCRESAIAALGSIGDPAGRDAVLAGCSDKATVRRRAVLALAAFEGPEVDEQLAAMAHDVDWQVRQAAEELLAV